MGDFQITLNVQGLTPVNPFVDVPTGAYKVKISDVDQKQSKEPGKPPNALFDVSIDEGDMRGAPQQIYLPLDPNGSEFIRRLWRTALLSVGAPVQNLDAGPISLSGQQFKGKTAYIFVTAVPAGEQKEGEPRQYADRKFITSDMYQKLRVMNQAPAGTAHAAGNGATATGGFTPVTPQPGSGTPVAAQLNF